MIALYFNVSKVRTLYDVELRILILNNVVFRKFKQKSVKWQVMKKMNMC